MKKGLVMEGGAMRGMFTAGVTDVLMENNIIFDGAIGVSAGAVFGCNYKSHQPGRVIRYNKRFCNDKRFCSFHSLRKTGDLYGHEFCYYTMPNELDIFDRETYNSTPMKFIAVATNVATGEAEYHDCKYADEEMLTWLRASGAMPLAARPVEIGNNTYVDGGISDSIPIKKMEELGYKKNVIVLTQPANYVKEKNKLLPLLKVVLRKYPRLIETIEVRHIAYNATLDYIREQEQKGNAFVIRPSEKLDVGMRERNPDKLRKIHAQGRALMASRIDELKAFLETDSLSK